MPFSFFSSISIDGLPFRPSIRNEKEEKKLPRADQPPQKEKKKTANFPFLVLLAICLLFLSFCSWKAIHWILWALGFQPTSTDERSDPALDCKRTIRFYSFGERFVFILLFHHQMSWPSRPHLKMSSFMIKKEKRKTCSFQMNSWIPEVNIPVLMMAALWAQALPGHRTGLMLTADPWSNSRKEKARHEKKRKLVFIILQKEKELSSLHFFHIGGPFLSLTCSSIAEAIRWAAKLCLIMPQTQRDEHALARNILLFLFKELFKERSTLELLFEKERECSPRPSRNRLRFNHAWRSTAARSNTRKESVCAALVDQARH